MVLDSKRDFEFEKGLWIRKGTLDSKRDFGFEKGREFDDIDFFFNYLMRGFYHEGFG